MQNCMSIKYDSYENNNLFCICTIWDVHIIFYVFNLLTCSLGHVFKVLHVAFSILFSSKDWYTNVTLLYFNISHLLKICTIKELWQNFWKILLQLSAVKVILLLKFSHKSFSFGNNLVCLILNLPPYRVHKDVNNT